MINVMMHEGFIKKLVYKMTKDRELARDLVQVGFLGLVEASKKFDFNKGVEFLTYGGLCAHGKMKQYLRDVVEKHSVCDSKEFVDIESPSKLEDEISKQDVLAQANMFLASCDKKSAEAFAIHYLSDRAKSHTKQCSASGVSYWTSRDRARKVKEKLIKYINQGE